MAFKFQMKRGTSAPSTGALDVAEFGYDYQNYKLYVGNGTGKNASGISMDGHGHDIDSITELANTLNTKVPATRKVNNKALSADISLTPGDVGAEPAIATKKTAFNVDFGTTAGTAAEGNHGHADLTGATNLNTGNTLIKRDATGKARVTTPTAGDDPQTISTIGYVNAVAQGLDPKDSVRVATVANITLTGTQTIDGIAVVVGNRVLVKNQSTASQNGIYIVASGAWTRALDADTITKLISAFVFVEEGNVNKDTGWVCINNAGDVLGTSAINWTQFAGKGDVDITPGSDDIVVEHNGNTFTISHKDHAGTASGGATGGSVIKALTLSNGHIVSYTYGTIKLTDLSDTPANYTGAGDKFLKVNSGGTAVEFIDVLDCGSY